MLTLAPGSQVKKDLSQVIGLLNAWKWKMSASGFFTIDRSLMSAVSL